MLGLHSPFYEFWNICRFPQGGKACVWTLLCSTSFGTSVVFLREEKPAFGMHSLFYGILDCLLTNSSGRKACVWIAFAILRVLECLLFSSVRKSLCLD